MCGVSFSSLEHIARFLAHSDEGTAYEIASWTTVDTFRSSEGVRRVP